MTMLYVPTTWRRNKMNIDMVWIITSPHPLHNVDNFDSILCSIVSCFGLDFLLTNHFIDQFMPFLFKLS